MYKLISELTNLSFELYLDSGFYSLSTSFTCVKAKNGVFELGFEIGEGTFAENLCGRHEKGAESWPSWKSAASSRRMCSL